MYVDSTQNKAVVFNYNLNTRFGEQLDEVKLQGLDANKKYSVADYVNNKTLSTINGSKPMLNISFKAFLLISVKASE